MKDLYLIITQKLIILKSSGFHVDFMWNLADFMKSLVTAPTLHSSNWRVFAETLAFIILGGFHRWYLGWNPLDFTGQICQISGWNLVDFMKSLVIAPTLHSSNWRVFPETLAFYNFGWISQVKSGWNPPDFTGEIHQISKVKSGGFQGWNPSPCIHQTEEFFAETLAFIILGGFHRWYLGEICWISWISWNLPDFMKFARFHLKSTRFHGEICRISPEICRISWNPYEICMKSTRFHEIRRISWNVSFCVMIKYRSFFRKTKQFILSKCCNGQKDQEDVLPNTANWIFIVTVYCIGLISLIKLIT